jgi:hypothetical protein
VDDDPRYQITGFIRIPRDLRALAGLIQLASAVVAFGSGYLFQRYILGYLWPLTEELVDPQRQDFAHRYLGAPTMLVGLVLWCVGARLGQRYWTWLVVVKWKRLTTADLEAVERDARKLGNGSV